MVRRRFERLSTWLAMKDTRRTTLHALGAGVVATGLSGLGLHESLAKNKNKKKNTKMLLQTCKKSSQCKGDLACQNANSQNSCFPTISKRCCKKLGETCNDSCECCGIDVICNGHICDSA